MCTTSVPIPSGVSPSTVKKYILVLRRYRSDGHENYMVKVNWVLRTTRKDRTISSSTSTGLDFTLTVPSLSVTNVPKVVLESSSNYRRKKWIQSVTTTELSRTFTGETLRPSEIQKLTSTLKKRGRPKNNKNWWDFPPTYITKDIPRTDSDYLVPSYPCMVELK